MLKLKPSPVDAILFSNLHTSRHHLLNNPHQSPILQRRRHPLLIPQLLTRLRILAMTALLHPNIDPVPRGKRLLQPYP